MNFNETLRHSSTKCSGNKYNCPMKVKTDKANMLKPITWKYEPKCEQLNQWLLRILNLSIAFSKLIVAVARGPTQKPRYFPYPNFISLFAHEVCEMSDLQFSRRHSPGSGCSSRWLYSDVWSSQFAAREGSPKG